MTKLSNINSECESLNEYLRDQIYNENSHTKHAQKQDTLNTLIVKRDANNSYMLSNSNQSPTSMENSRLSGKNNDTFSGNSNYLIMTNQL